MPEARVPIERTVTETSPKTHYRGRIKIMQSEFEYELAFKLPIPGMSADLQTPKSIPELRDAVRLTVKRDIRAIPLNDDEYLFFYQILVQLAIDFSRDPNSLKAPNVEWPRPQPPPLPEIISVTAGSAAKMGYFTLSENICRILNGPKFKCGISDGDTRLFRL